jgi:hypothetical protein
MLRVYRLFAFATAGLFLPLLLPALGSARDPLPDAVGVVIYDTRSAFNTDAPGLPVEDWEEGHVTGPFVFCNPPLNANSNDACFLPGEILPGLEHQDAPLGGGADHVGLGGPGSWSMPSKFVYTNRSEESTNLFFTPTVTAVGLDISSNGIGNMVLISVYDINDTLIVTDTTMVGNLGELTFWGVISSVPIERLNIAILNSEFVDNIAFGGAVPPITPTPSATATATATPTPSPTPEVPTALGVTTVTTPPGASWHGIMGAIALLLTLGGLRRWRRPSC